MHKIKILGAGPAGLGAAINLAKAGYEVDVFEKNQDVGKRFRGDLQGLENWSEKGDVLAHLQEMNIEVNFDCDPFAEFRVTDGFRLETITFKKPFFYLVKRGPLKGSLDQGLKKQALQAGVRIHFGQTLLKPDIAATGPISREIAGIDKGIVFKTKIKDIAIGMVNEQSDVKGYSYLLVTKGYGCMGTVLVDQLDAVNRCLEKTKQLFSGLIDLDIRNPRPMGGVASFSTKNIFQENGTRYVGEAAGIQDLLWGYGIRSALTSGFLAARSIITGKSYDILARKQFHHKLKAGVVNRFFWEKLVSKRFPFFMNKLKTSKDPFPFFYSFHQFNRIQKLLYPVARYSLRRRYPTLRL